MRAKRVSEDLQEREVDICECARVTGHICVAIPERKYVVLLKFRTSRGVLVLIRV